MDVLGGDGDKTPSTLFKGDVLIQVEQNGKRIMEFRADEAGLMLAEKAD